jgi:hypothetical protein
MLLHDSNIFKIGITIYPEKLLKYFPKKSKYIIIFASQDARYLENILVSKYNMYYTQRNDIGPNYYEGNLELAKYDFMKTSMDIQNLCTKYPLPITQPPSMPYYRNVNSEIFPNQNTNINRKLPNKINKFYQHNCVWTRREIRQNAISSVKTMKIIFC